MSSRPPDPAWDTLVQVTLANPDMERGKLNTALKAIKAAWQREGGLPDDLPREIELRADAYHAVWPMLTLTPTALATHWHRVMAKPASERSKQQAALDELKRRDEPKPLPDDYWETAQ